MFSNELFNFITNITDSFVLLVSGFIYLSLEAIPLLIVFVLSILMISNVYFKSLRETTRIGKLVEIINVF